MEGIETIDICSVVDAISMLRDVIYKSIFYWFDPITIFYWIDSRGIRTRQFLECGKFDHQPTNVRLQKLVTINLVVEYLVVIEIHQR